MEHGSKPIRWERLAAAAARVGVTPRLLLSSIETGRATIRVQHLGKRNMIHVCADDVDRFGARPGDAREELTGDMRMQPKFTDPWRETVYRDALRAGVSTEIAALIATRIATEAEAPEEMRTARDISGMTAVVGASQLALPMIRAGMSADRAAAVLRDARPRSGKDRIRLTSAGIGRVKFATMTAGIWANRRQA